MTDKVPVKVPTRRHEIRQHLLKAVEEGIEPVPVSFSYRIVMFLVGCVMLLLPLAYLILIFLMGHTIYWHIKYLNSVPAAGSRGEVSGIAVLGSLVLLPIVLLFLLKPLFYRDPKDTAKPQRLKEAAEPFLFEYVAAICDAVGSPAPKSIRVDCQVNASASLRRGFGSLFSDDLTLTIGLPLVAGMTTRELTGILAHEFGHFAQTAGMRASFLTSNINYWFWRAVYKRDRLDDMMIGACEAWDIRIIAFVYVARMGVWMTRLILFALAWVGSAISCLLLRQMEFDADRYEARMVGSNAFSKSTMRIQQLGFANYMAMEDLRRFHEESRLADNLPKLIVSNIPHITPEIRKALREEQRSQKTGLFDTHPADNERIKNARMERTKGIWTMPEEFQDCPASMLFDEFDRLCRISTQEYYEACLGEDFDKKRVMPTEKLVAERDAEFEARKALDRYFQVHLPILQPLPLSDAAMEKPENAKETAQRVKEAREALVKSVPEYRALCHRFEKAESLMLRTGEALASLECRLKVRAKYFDLKSIRRSEVEEMHDRACDGVQQLAANLVEFETNASNRLTGALQLLNVSSVASRLPNAEEIRHEIHRLIPEGIFVSGLMAELGTMRILFRRLSSLCGLIDKNRQNRRLIEKILDQMERLHTRLTLVQKKMRKRDYPFNTDMMNLTLVEYAMPTVPDDDDLMGLVGATSNLYDKLAGLQVRIFARLAHTAEQIETILGMPPLPEPVFDKPKRDDDDE
jgi:Zn-dependent protease with chaperone function